MHICMDELYAFILLIPHTEIILLRARGYWRRLRSRAR